MVSNPRAPFFPAPGEIDTSRLSAFLSKEGVDLQRIDTMIARAKNAVLRYGQPHDHMRLKCRLETVSAAAEKLIESLPSLGSIEYVEFVSAIASTIPQEFNERMRGFWHLPMTLEMLKDSAKSNLVSMARPGAPSAKISFVRELMIIWLEGTGKNPGASGAGTFDKPRSRFGKFVKLCVQMIPADHREFENDFGGLLRRALTQRVFEPVQKI